MAGIGHSKPEVHLCNCGARGAWSPCPEVQFLSQQHLPKGTRGSHEAACEVRGLDTLGGGDGGIQVSSLGLGGKVALDTIWKGFCKCISAWKRKLKSQVKMLVVVMYGCESWTIE